MAGSTRENGSLISSGILLLAQAALTAAAAFGLGPAGLLLLCVILWPLAAWMREKYGWAAYGMPVILGAVSLFFLEGKMAAPMAAWCMGCGAAMALTDLRLPPLAERPRWQRESVLYGGMALAALVAVILCLQRSYPAGIATGIAHDLAAAVGSAPNSAEMLYAFHQSGLVPLDASMTLVTEGADGLLYMTEEVRLQLLYGLRTRLEETMALVVPTWSVYLTALTAILSVMLPVNVRRRRGEKDETPRFDKWRLPRDMGVRLGVLFAGGIFPLFTDAAVFVTMGQLMSAVAGLVFGVLGAAVLRFASRLAGRRGPMAWLMILLAAAFVPQLLTILGIADHLMDFRKLNKKNETEENRE